MGKPRVLVIEDEAAVAEMLGLFLQKNGYEFSVCADGEQAYAAFVSYQPELVLLDVMLPGKSGHEVAQQIRNDATNPTVPIIMLTAKSDTHHVVRGLEAGADDYVGKPFNPAELVARIKARLRSGEQKPPEMLHLGDLTIDVAGHTVRRGDEQISLTPLEFDLLVALARRPWQVFSREVLLEEVWGYRHSADTRLVNVHVQRLRSKVERDPDSPQIVLTVRGVGYKAGPSVP